MRRIGTRHTVPVSCRHRTAQAGLLRHTPGPTCATARRHAVHVSGTGWAAGQMWRRTLKTDWSLRSTSPRHAITTSSACRRRRRRRRRRVQWGRPGYCRPLQRRHADSVAGFHLARLPAALPGESLSDGRPAAAAAAARAGKADHREVEEPRVASLHGGAARIAWASTSRQPGYLRRKEQRGILGRAAPSHTHTWSRPSPLRPLIGQSRGAIARSKPPCNRRGAVLPVSAGSHEMPRQVRFAR